MTANISPQLEKRLTMAVERMPAFPQSVQSVIELTRRIDCLPKDLVAVIEKDPVMTLKILRTVNSAFYGIQEKISSVGQASVYLGINTIKNLALSFAAFGVMPRFSSQSFNIQAYLQHSLVVAVLCRILGEKFAANEVDPTDCYIVGLLHDFGKVVFARFLSAEFSRALGNARDLGEPLHDAERYVIGADHAWVGALLAKRWQFSEDLVNTIGEHHNLAAEATPLLDCLRMADAISRRRQLGDAGNAWRDGEMKTLPKRFGGDMHGVMDEIGELHSVLREVEAFTGALAGEEDKEEGKPLRSTAKSTRGGFVASARRVRR